jgi:hypothetical protein
LHLCCHCSGWGDLFTIIPHTFFVSSFSHLSPSSASMPPVGPMLPTPSDRLSCSQFMVLPRHNPTLPANSPLPVVFNCENPGINRCQNLVLHPVHIVYICFHGSHYSLIRLLVRD